MELANHFSGADNTAVPVRTATSADSAAILKLLRQSLYTHTHVDWHVPGDWLGIPGFVVWPEAAAGRQTDDLHPFTLPPRRRLRACLAAAPDSLPAAWVRVAAVADEGDIPEALAVMLAAIVPWLRETAVDQLAWLPIDSWPSRWLPALGFSQVNEIIGYQKVDTTLPPTPEPPALTIRPATAVDFPALAALEADAFDPIWRNSAASLSLAERQALSFDVALWQGELAGFQFSAPSRRGAHLVRLTVHPDFQGTGIGSALLAATLRDYYRRDLYKITLNTQGDNLASQRLYQKFGFQPNGTRLPIWALPIT